MTGSPSFLAYHPESIWLARRAFFDEGREAVGQIDEAVLRSWRRCHGQGRSVHDAVAFAPVERPGLQLLLDRNRALLQAAQPELGSLARSVSEAGYAVLLVDARGQALAVDGAISSHSAPLRNAFRRGVDLSEASIGTSAMSVAMSEQQALSVCGPEHFFSDVQIFHCCAAPVFDPQGDVVGAVDVSHDMPGMLRSALWLASRCAQRIERRLFQELPAYLRLEIDVDEGSASAGAVSTQAWVALDEDGQLMAASRAARQLMGLDPQAGGLSFDALFGVRFEPWVSRLRAGVAGGEPLQLPCGIRLRARPMAPDATTFATRAPVARAARAATPGPRPGLGDARLAQAFERALRAFRAELPVLLTGETGTGKEVAARALHAAGPCAEGPFVALNCAAIPGELLAGELFGHVDGAYTGSRRGGAPGKVEAAQGGTLFLDEIGDMPLPLQAAVLRVLDSREVVRLGDVRSRRIDVRVVCATHRDLRAAVVDGRFREDLYYRVAGHVMTLLPLRERQDFDGILDGLLAACDASPTRVPPAVRARLRQASWPGNVRQLSHALRRALALAEPDAPLKLEDFEDGAPLDEPAAAASPRTRDSGLLRQAQERAIAQALAQAGGNVTEAARRLGMGRATLYRKLGTLKLAGSRAE